MYTVDAAMYTVFWWQTTTEELEGNEEQSKRNSVPLQEQESETQLYL
jgi:hypothetical protein